MGLSLGWSGFLRWFRHWRPLSCTCLSLLPLFFPPFVFPLRLTSGLPSLFPRSPVASGHPPCALWCRFSTPVPDRLLWLLTVSVGLADLHCLPPAPALPPEYHGWPGERCDAMLSWHPDIFSGPVNRRKRQTERGVGFKYRLTPALVTTGRDLTTNRPA